jgi:integrase
VGVSFSLARPKNERSSIRVKVSVDGSQIILYPGKSILVSDWDKRKCFLKQSAGIGLTNRTAKALRKLEGEILEVLDEYKNGSTKFRYNELKVRLQALIDNPRAKFNSEIKKPVGVIETLASFMDLFISDCENGVRLAPNRQKLQPSTVADYKKTLQLFKRFELEKRRDIVLNELKQVDLDGFSDYLIMHLNLAMNTHGKMLTHLQQVLKYATKMQKYPLDKFNELVFDTKREESDNIYLTEAEILEMLGLANLKSRQEVVRDVFVVGCFTGMRFSDYSMIDAQSIRNNKLEFVQKKTRVKVTIPIHPVVNQILNKYDYHLPAVKYDEFNRIIKVLGQKVPSLSSNFTKQITYGREKRQVTHARWEFIQTHTCRRSFCTNEYLRGTEPLMIMAISGHKTLTSFLKYIKVTNEQQAELMGQIWNQRQKNDDVT